MESLDHTDIQLLTALQTNAQLTSEKLGELLNLSASQVGRRRQKLEAEGYIDGYRAKLKPERLGLTVQAFVKNPEVAEDALRLSADSDAEVVYPLGRD